MGSKVGFMGSKDDSMGSDKPGINIAASLLVKLLAAAAALIMLFACGCAGENRGSDPDGVTDGSRTVYIGRQLKGMPLPDALEAYEAASCVGTGTDLYYGYEGLSITAYPDGGSGHYIGSIEISGGVYKTLKGAYPGMSVEAFKALYGEPDNTPFGRLVYSLGSGVTLTVTLSDEQTVGIIVLAKSVN